MRQLALPLALLLALSACESARPPEVQTSRAEARALDLPAEEEAFHFLIFGDRTGGPAEGVEVLAQAVEDTNLLDPDLVMTVGDLVEGYNETSEWLEQMAEFRGIMDGLEMPWFPVAGNHDIYWKGSEPPPGHHEANYEEHFGPLWYWFAHKNAAFIVLYTDEGDRETNRKGFRGKLGTQMSAEQLAWLKATLAETAGYDHVFVFLHHPRWNEDVYPESNWPETHRFLAEAGNVTAVFAGHRHRQRYDGVTDGIAYYTLSSTGGGMPMDLPGSGWLHHMNHVVVREDGIEVATVPVGQVLDPKEMTPEYLADIDAARALVPTPENPPLLLAGNGTAAGEAVFRMENASTRPLEVNTRVTSAAGDWRAVPDHDHSTLKPGETATLRFALERLAGADAYSAPELIWQVDYLGERRRVSLPEVSRLIPLRPGPDVTAGVAPAADKVLALDGTGAAVFAADRVALPDGPFTLEAWFRADSLGGYKSIAGKSQDAEYILMLVRGLPFFVVHLDGAYAIARAESDDKVAVGDWHHLAGVYDGDELRLYLDGRLIASKAAAGNRTLNDLPLIVGADPAPSGDPSYGFDGLIDGLRLSSVARYSGEAFTPAVRHAADEDTLLLLHLDGEKPPFVIDAGPGGHHGLLSGGARFQSRAGS
ncbi:MAG: LamG-like jellyroll fold domain-containing protein [Pseudomonadota bacterium]